ncbi:hypothetical protein oki108_13540 [Helicobacter pylori]
MDQIQLSLKGIARVLEALLVWIFKNTNEIDRSLRNSIERLSRRELESENTRI